MQFFNSTMGRDKSKDKFKLQTSPAGAGFGDLGSTSAFRGRKQSNSLMRDDGSKTASSVVETLANFNVQAKEQWLKQSAQMATSTAAATNFKGMRSS